MSSASRRSSVAVLIVGLFVALLSATQSTAWAVPVPDAGTFEGGSASPEGNAGGVSSERLPVAAPRVDGARDEAPAASAPELITGPEMAAIGETEAAELDALANPSVILGTRPLIFDPTPDDAASGDEAAIGSITFEIGTGDEFNLVQVTYEIAPAFQAQYDLQDVRTTINESLVDSGLTPLPGDDEASHVHTLALPVPLAADVTSLSIRACATIRSNDVDAVTAGLPAVGTVRVDTNGNVVAPSSYFDTIVFAGAIPTSTDVVGDTVTFNPDTGWSTGDAVRVVASHKAVGPASTGLVTVPTTPDTTASASYFIRSLGAGVYSFHATYNDAIAGTNPKDIGPDAIPTTGEIIVTGEDAALPFLGQTPINESLVPASTKTTLTTTTGPLVTATDTTNDTVDLASAVTWANGDRVQVSGASGGGLNANTTYYVRVVDGDTVSFHTSWAGAQNNTVRVNITAAIATTRTVDAVDPDDETVTFTADPGWTTGTAVRVNTTGGGLSAGTTYFVHGLGGGVYSFFDTYANATNGDADPNPLNGRKDLAAPITASIFANLTTLSFPQPHHWVSGTVVRVSATGGGLAASTNYYVGVIDADTISLHTTLANVGSDTRIVFSAPVTAVLTQAFNGWCVDNDRFIGGNEYIANIISSYDNSFPDSADHPKDQYGTEAGISPVNTSAIPSTTDLANDRVTFAASHNWATQQAVRVTATDDGLSAGTTYYVRSINANTVSFHPTAAASNNAGPAPASTIFANVGVAPDSTNTTAETVTYTTDPGWADATLVRVTATGGGLTAGTNYYVHNFTGGVYSFYTNPTDASAGLAAGRMNLTAAVTAQVYAVTLGSTEDTVTFGSGHGFATGDIVTPTGSGGGLTGGAAYHLYNVGGDTFSFHTASPTADNKVNLTASITTNLNERVDLTAAISASTIVFRAESIDFAVNHAWPNGTKVKVDVDDGGLLASMAYYVRAQGIVGGAADANSASLYDTREHAQAGGLTGLITLTDPIETTTVFYVPENLVEYPENLDVVNWVLNQNFQGQLAVGKAPDATTYADTAQVPASTSFDNVGSVPTSTDTTAETVTFGADPGWATATMVRADATGGGLSAGTNYYVRNLGGGVYSFYNSVANANAGGATGRINLTAAVTADIFTPSLPSTEDTVTFNSGHGFVTGSVVNVTADGGELDASTTYYLYNVGGDTFSFHTAAVATAANKVNLTAAVEPRAVHLQTDNTVTVPVYGWATGLKVQVSATGGGLTAGTDYYVRAVNATTIAFYATAADASNNVNRIDLTAAIEPALVRPYYTEGDIQRTVWELIENTPGDPGGWSPLRVAEILALADEAVGLNEMSIGYVPDCGGTVAVILQPFEVEGETNEQITIAQVTVAEIPNYCVEGYSCDEITLDLGSISGTKFEDIDGDGTKDDGELGLAGWLVFVDYDGDGVFDYSDANDSGTFDEGDTALEPYDVTDATGAYEIGGVLPGTWTVREVGQPDWVATAPASGEHTVSVTMDDTTFENVDFGNFQLVDVCGVKVWDIDRDGANGGISDVGDFRMSGVRIFVDEDTDGELDWTDGDTPNGIWDAGEGERWTATDANGAYCFFDLGPGTYDVQEDESSLPGDPDEWGSSGAPAPIAATSGTDVTGAHFYNHKFYQGEYLTYSQGGYAGSGAPGQYLLANFAGAFPTGLVVPRAAPNGDIVLVSGAEAQAFLKANSRNKFSNATVSGYVPSNLETQFVALTLSVGFDAYDASFGASSSKLGDLTLCNLAAPYDVANGLTVSGYLSQVYAKLDGTGNGLGLSSGQLVDLLNRITLGFDASAVTPWAEEHLC